MNFILIPSKVCLVFAQCHLGRGETDSPHRWSLLRKGQAEVTWEAKFRAWGCEHSARFIGPLLRAESSEMLQDSSIQQEKASHHTEPPRPTAAQPTARNPQPGASSHSHCTRVSSIALAYRHWRVWWGHLPGARPGPGGNTRVPQLTVGTAPIWRVDWAEGLFLKRPPSLGPEEKSRLAARDPQSHSAKAQLLPSTPSPPLPADSD